MKTNVEIEFQNLPDEIINEFQSFLKKADFTSSSLKNTLIYHNATGGPADLIIYLDQHIIELVSAQIIARAAYDILKESVISTWKKVISHYKKKKGDIQEDKNYISLNFKVSPDETIEYQLNGNVDEKAVLEITDKLFEHLKNKQVIKTDLTNPDYKDPNETKPIIRMRFNSQTQKWEVVDYAAWQRQIDKWKHEAEDRFSG